LSSIWYFITLVDCKGAYQTNNETLRCWKFRIKYNVKGDVSRPWALIKSSNQDPLARLQTEALRPPSPHWQPPPSNIRWANLEPRPEFPGEGVGDPQAAGTESGAED
jgi:hypothetical protein